MPIKRDIEGIPPLHVGWPCLRMRTCSPPDPEVLEGEPPELDQLEGLSLHLTRVMSHFQCEECQCSICGAASHFARDCPHQNTFCNWHKEHLKSQGQALDNRSVPTPKDPITEVVPWVITMHCSSSLINNGPTAHLIGPETLVNLSGGGQGSYHPC